MALPTQASNIGEKANLAPRRLLEQRHVQMIAIAGTIGTALFLGSGQALSGGGPVGALLAYALVGSVAYASLSSVGEMTSLAPVPGSFTHYADRWVDEAAGFAVGWVSRIHACSVIPSNLFIDLFLYQRLDHTFRDCWCRTSHIVLEGKWSTIHRINNGCDLSGQRIWC